MKKALITLMIVFYPYLAIAKSDLARAESNSAGADTNPPIPNITGWVIVNDESHIDLQVSDRVIAYLGIRAKYQNPDDSREFVRLISRYNPVVFGKPKKPNERLLNEKAIQSYSERDRLDYLNKLAKETDPIIYIRWRTKEDSRTGRDLQDGDAEVWLLSADGNWFYKKIKPASHEPTRPELAEWVELVDVEFLTENSGNGESPISAGIAYSIKSSQFGEISHIVRINRNDLMQLLEGGE